MATSASRKPGTARRPSMALKSATHGLAARRSTACEPPVPPAACEPATCGPLAPAALRPVFLLTFPQRARGLLGRSVAWLRPDEVLVFAPCASIHTLGMREPIDVAFLSSTGAVLRSERAVAPGRLLRCPGAALTLERFTRPEVPAAARPPWPSEGQRLQLHATGVKSAVNSRGLA